MWGTALIICTLLMQGLGKDLREIPRIEKQGTPTDNEIRKLIHQGLLFEPVGRLVTATGKWTLVIQVRTLQLQHRAEGLKKQMVKVSQAFHNLILPTTLPEYQSTHPRGDQEPQDDPSAEHTRKAIKILGDIWLQEEESMEARLQHATTQLNEMQTLVSGQGETAIPFASALHRRLPENFIWNSHHGRCQET